MAGRQAGSSGSEPPSSPRGSPPKVVVDDSPLQPAMGKHKESLKVKLMMRRPITQLVAQGIMPPLKTPPAYFEQCKQLERAKTGDLLKAKIQRRPDRQELERRHILEQESHVDPSLAERQRMLKKARIADQLNDSLSHRPGPLELIKKNILHTEENIETAVKSGTLSFKATSEGASGRPPHPSSYCGPPDDASPSPSPPSTLSPASVASPPQHPAPGKDKKKKTKQKQLPKARFKFHEYKGPPNAQKASSPPAAPETPYELLIQQQQLLLQLMPASPAPSCASAASAASDGSDAYAPPPPPPPPGPPVPAARIEDMKVSDLRAECKRRNLRVSGPKPQLLDRLRPFLERPDDAPRSPASVGSLASPAPAADPDPEDIVQSQRRHIEELERKLEASRRQLEAVRRDAAGAAASDQSRRLLQAHICVSQLRAQLDALTAPAPTPPPPPAVTAAASPARYLIDAAPDRLLRVFAVAPSPAPPDDAPKAAASPAYILNGVKVVPIAILPSAPFAAEPAPPPPPPPLPPPPPRLRAHERDDDSQIMDDVLEILVENGELPRSAVGPAELADGYSAAADAFSPAAVLSEEALSAHDRAALAADELQRELADMNEIMKHADMHTDMGAVDAALDCDPSSADLDSDLLSNSNFAVEFNSDPSSVDHDVLFGCYLGDERADEGSRHTAMDVSEDAPERMSVTPLTNGDILHHGRTLEYIDDLSLPSFEESKQSACDDHIDLKEFGIETSDMSVDEGFSWTPPLIPNVFGRGHVPQRDPLLGGVFCPPPRPQRKHYSWDRIEFDAT